MGKGEGGGGVFSGRRVGIYVFITRTRLQRFTRQELRIEMRGVQCDYQRVKSFLETVWCEERKKS